MRGLFVLVVLIEEAQHFSHLFRMEFIVLIGVIQVCKVLTITDTISHFPLALNSHNKTVTFVIL